METGTLAVVLVALLRVLPVLFGSKTCRKFGLGAVLFAQQFLALMSTYVACLLAYWVVLARLGFDFGTSS